MIRSACCMAKAPCVPRLVPHQDYVARPGTLREVFFFLSAGDDENWTAAPACQPRAGGSVRPAARARGSAQEFEESCRFPLGKTRASLYIGGPGVPAQCVGALSCAPWKRRWLGPISFWASCGIYLKGS